MPRVQRPSPHPAAEVQPVSAGMVAMRERARTHQPPTAAMRPGAAQNTEGHFAGERRAESDRGAGVGAAAERGPLSWPPETRAA